MKLVESGWNLLVQPRTEKEVYAGILGVLEKRVLSETRRFYRDGRAAEVVAHVLLEEHVAHPFR